MHIAMAHFSLARIDDGCTLLWHTFHLHVLMMDAHCYGTLFTCTYWWWMHIAMARFSLEILNEEW